MMSKPSPLTAMWPAPPLPFDELQVERERAAAASCRRRRCGRSSRRRPPPSPARARLDGDIFATPLSFGPSSRRSRRAAKRAPRTASSGATRSVACARPRLYTRSGSERIGSIGAVAAAGIHHLGVAVADLDEAVETYRRLFGAELELRETLADQGVETALLRVGDDRIELLAVARPGHAGRAGSSTAAGPGMHHVAFEVDRRRGASSSGSRPAAPS